MHMAVPERRKATQLLCNAFIALIPSFVIQLFNSESQHKPHRLYPTSYLDGLRGIAAVIVFFCHYTEENHKYMLPSFHIQQHDDISPSPLQFPFLRILYSGRPMVHIFFVISGFALSYKPLKELRTRNFSGFHAALSSSAFRRPLRLCGPPIVSTILVFIMIRLGWVYKPQPTLTEQFWDWAKAVYYTIVWPWSWDADLRPKYDVHLWTISIEFCHSMLLFVVLFTLSRVRYQVRLLSTIMIMVYCLTCGKWAAFEFISGMMLAEFHLIASERLLDRLKLYEYHDEPEHLSKFKFALETLCHILVIVVALFVGGWPNHDAAMTWGIKFLHKWTPSSFPLTDEVTAQKFWFALTAVGTVWSCGRLSMLKRALESGFAQYCGRVSFAVYIVHGPVLELWQDALIGEPPKAAVGFEGQKDYKPAVIGSGVKGLIGVETVVGRTSCWFIGLVLFAPVVFWVADVFCRLVDETIVDIARRMERYCAIEEPERAYMPTSDRRQTCR